jgi:hypothetical protein
MDVRILIKKTNHRTRAANCEINLLRLINSSLTYIYCSTILFNPELIRLKIRLAKYTHFVQLVFLVYIYVVEHKFGGETTRGLTRRDTKAIGKKKRKAENCLRTKNTVADPYLCQRSGTPHMHAKMI